MHGADVVCAAMPPSPCLLGGVKELVKLGETVVFGCCSDAHCFRGKWLCSGVMEPSSRGAGWTEHEPKPHSLQQQQAFDATCDGSIFRLDVYPLLWLWALDQGVRAFDACTQNNGGKKKN